MGELSPRERQILGLIAQGRTTKAIAAELHIRPSTVSWHVANIFSKLGASSRAEAVAIAAARPVPPEARSLPSVMGRSAAPVRRGHGIGLGAAAALAAIVLSSPLAFVSDSVRERPPTVPTAAPPGAATPVPVSSATPPVTPAIPAVPTIPASTVVPSSTPFASGIELPVAPVVSPATTTIPLITIPTGVAPAPSLPAVSPLPAHTAVPAPVAAPTQAVLPSLPSLR